MSTDVTDSEERKREESYKSEQEMDIFMIQMTERFVQMKQTLGCTLFYNLGTIHTEMIKEKSSLFETKDLLKISTCF